MVLVPGDNTCYTQEDLKCMNLLQHPVWIFDVVKTRMFWANYAALKVWNASSLQEFLQRDFAADMTQATSNRLLDLLLVLQKGGTIHEQYTIYPNQGPGKTISLSMSGIRIEEDGHIAMLCEGELAHNDKIHPDSTLATETLRHIPIAVCRFEMDGTLQYQNPEAIQTFGSTVQRNKDNFVDRFLDRELGKNVLKKVQEDGNEQMGTVEAELYTRDGPRWFAVRARKTRNPVSSVSGNNDKMDSKYMIVDTVRDVTEIKQAQKDTIRARIKNDFLAQIAHEIRTPLHQVVGNMDLLELQTLDAKQLEIVHTVQSSTDQLMTIISDMLDYSKLESGMMLLDHVPFDIQDLMESTRQAIRQDLEEKNLTFILNMEMENDLNLDSTGEFESLLPPRPPLPPRKHKIPPRLMGDPNRLRQILYNFLDNAIKFTDKGSISVSVTTVTTAPTTRQQSSLSSLDDGSDHSHFSRKADESMCSPSPSLDTGSNQNPIGINKASVSLDENSNHSPSKIRSTLSSSASCSCRDSKRNLNRYGAAASENQHDRVVLLRFEVRDTGIGIDPTQLKSVFQKYKQAHSGIKANYGGVGLGLAICKNLIKLMKGRLGMESELHVGTLVWFEIPFDIVGTSPKLTAPVATAHLPSLDFTQQQPTMPSTGAAAWRVNCSNSNNTTNISMRSLHVLVAEDNKTNQKMVQSMLQRIGHRVSVAGNGQECMDELAKVRQARQEPFDLVLMDIQMPIMDGIEATRKIREHYDKSKLPVVGLTASYRHEDLEYYMGIGMNHCIGKPVKLNTLKRAIESMARDAAAIPAATEAATVQGSAASGCEQEEART